MITENSTLKEILENPVIAQIAPDCVKNIDFSKENYYKNTLQEIEDSGRFQAKSLVRGFNCLFAQAETGNYYFPVYEKEECSDDPKKEGVNLVWLPSKEKEADNRPYILLVPGGGYVNVWNLTEGWPIAAQFNECGYHVFVLTYRVIGPKLLNKPIDDMANALKLIHSREKEFHVAWDRYITCGFSAGGNLICLWSSENHGYTQYQLPKPQATFPVYPVISWKLCSELEDHDEFAITALGTTVKEAAESDYNIEEHAETFPPCHLFLAAEDTLVNPEHSKLLKRELDRLGIPCEIEIGPTGGHGFADGTGMCMEGWVKRAVKWYETL